MKIVYNLESNFNHNLPNYKNLFIEIVIIEPPQ